MVDTRDILLKAAGDVQSGMWCKGGWFIDDKGREYREGGALWNEYLIGSAKLTVDQALAARRCAGGSIILAAYLLNGDYDDAYVAMELVREGLGAVSLQNFNDEHLPDDPFEAGQQLAELFRQTAETL